MSYSIQHKTTESRPPIRSPWPQLQIGKLLDDKTIAKYEAAGYYSSPFVALRRLQQKEAADKALQTKNGSGKRAKARLAREKLLKLFA